MPRVTPSSVPSLGEFLDQEVLPRLTPELVFDHPAHNWQKCGSNKWQGGCPWHDSKSGSAFYLDVDTLSWRCPACHIGGGPVQYVGLSLFGNDRPRGQTFVDVVEELARRAGIPMPQQQQSPEQIEIARKRQDRQQAIADVIAHTETALWSPAGEQARTYLHGRGFSDGDIYDLHIGFYESVSDVETLLRSRGHDLAICRKAGLIWPKLQGFCLFPWTDVSGQPLTLYAKWPAKTLPKQREHPGWSRDPKIQPDAHIPKTLALPGAGTKACPLYFYNARRGGHKDLIAVEGVTDAAIGQVRGLSEMVAYVAASFSQAQIDTLKRHGIRSVTIVPDPDSGGDNGAISSVKRLTEAGIESYVAPRLPDEEDPDDFIEKYGADAFRAYVKQSVPGYIFRARAIFAKHDLSDDRGQLQATEEIAAYVAGISDPRHVSDVLRLTSEATRYSIEVLQNFVATAQQQAESRTGTSRHYGKDSPDVVHTGPVDVGALNAKLSLYKLTDLGNAERLVARYGAHLRYCYKWGAWLIWSGTHWKIDETGEIVRLARRTVRAIYDEVAALAKMNAAHQEEGEFYLVNDSSEEPQRDPQRDPAVLAYHAKKSEAYARIQAMITLAQSDCPVSPDDLDADHWLLNCENGTLDLRTGDLRRHSRENLITKRTGIVYDPEATCPQWEKFLARVIPAPEVRAYVQRACGYALTGSTEEQCLFFLYGSGKNGKSVFTSILEKLLSDYWGKTRAETLMQKRDQGGIPNDVAALRGLRLCTVSEVNQGQRLNEALIKDLSGGDMLTARFLHHEFFSFKPTFKLWMYGNHKPTIRGTDEGIWRRIRLIPFIVTIPAEERNARLPDELCAELPGILTWAVQGCMEWQSKGLSDPAQVIQATEGYRAEMDVLTPFFTDECIEDPDGWTSKADLWKAYEQWAKLAGEQVFQTARGFNAEVKKRKGIKDERLTIKQDFLPKGTRIWGGVILNNDTDPETRQDPPPAEETESGDATSPVTLGDAKIQVFPELIPHVEENPKNSVTERHPVTSVTGCALTEVEYEEAEVL